LSEFEHRVRAEDFDDACRVLKPINDCLYRWGHYVRMVELREKLRGQLTDPWLRAANLSSLGNTYRDLKQFELAVKCHKEALAIACELNNRAEERRHRSNLGSAYRAQGYVEQALKLYEEALVIAHELGDRRRAGAALGNLGSAYRLLGQVERAIESHKQAMAIARKRHDRPREGSELARLGNAYIAQGQVKRAIELLEQARDIARELGYRKAEMVDLSLLGKAHRAQRHIRRAIMLHEEALSIAREIGNSWGESSQLLGMGKALLITGKLSEAGQRCREARNLDVPETRCSAALTLGIVLLHQRDQTAGKTFADAAIRCRSMLGKTAGLYEARYALAAALVGQAVCSPRWAEESDRAEMLAGALAEYRRALGITAAPGVVQDAICDLELIRAAGIEGLEPVFELLENSGYEPDLPEDLSDILEEAI
jgi:tetratricopeptide (TPR) repeat protein